MGNVLSVSAVGTKLEETLSSMMSWKQSVDELEKWAVKCDEVQ